MKINLVVFLILFSAMTFLFSCKDQSTEEQTPAVPKSETISLMQESVSFTTDSVTSNSYIVYDKNKTGIRPAVLIIPEWWGLNDYPKSRANQLAEMGYLAMAVDMYGDGKTADNPKDAENMAGLFYQYPQMALNRINAAIAKIKTMPQADTTQIAAIGYCFGGGVLLNVARLGANLAGVVSFHGSLLGTPANKELLKSRILVCHGAADPFVPESEVNAFKKSMDSINAVYTFKAYPDAVHAFTNPGATESGKKFNIPIAYNAAADSASWEDMKVFFGSLFTK